MKRKSPLPQLDIKTFSEHFQHLHLLPWNFCVDEVDFPEGNINVKLNRTFNYEEVRESLQNLKCGKSAGQDSIYPEFLKHIPRFLLEVLNSFLNLVLSTGVLSND